MWPSGKLAAKTLERQAHNTQVLVFQPLRFGPGEVAWLLPFLSPCCPGFELESCMMPWRKWQGRHLWADSQIPFPNTRLCTNSTSSPMLWKRKPTKINIDISRVMKQLQSWCTVVSPHFVACLHLQRGERAGDTGVGRHLLWGTFRGALWPISYFLREARVVWLLNTFRHLKLPNPKENHAYKWSSSIT